VQRAFALHQPRLPLSEGVALTLDWDGKPMSLMPNADQVSYVNQSPLASVHASVPSVGGVLHELTIRAHAYDMSALYAPLRMRWKLFGALIGCAGLTALIGLFWMHRAFRRQMQLGEMKTNFVSSVSHELRAPIASVRLMAESLHRGKVTDSTKQHDYFRFIAQECRRLSSLIENVLDFARIEQGRKEYELEPTDLWALVKQTVNLMESYAQEKQVHLTLQPLPADPSDADYAVAADERAIQQALVNLIDNAIKHSPPGETVTVGLERQLFGEAPAEKEKSASRAKAPRASLVLWVADRGPGIPETERDRIFEQFYRRGSELRRETQGIGIGLSIVQHIVQAHGGRVMVENEPGRGSRFTMMLPVGNTGNVEG
jgi:signal transduction histidine kinase